MFQSLTKILGSKSLTFLLFSIYALAIIWVLVFKLYTGGVLYADHMRSLNLVPFAAPTRFNGEVDLGEMILNVLIFMPLGVYLTALFEKWSWLKIIIAVFLTSTTIEALQWVFRLGASDITDVLTNSLGGLFGLILYKGLVNISKSKAQKILNLVALVLTITMMAFLAYLKIKQLWIFRMDLLMIK